MPARILRSVDLPVPLPPTRPVRSSGVMSQLASSKRSFWPKRLPAEESWSIPFYFLIGCGATRRFCFRCCRLSGSDLRIIHIFGCGCRYRLLRSRRCDHHYADQNEQSPKERSQTKGFATEEISKQHGHDRIDVSVGPDFCWRFMMDQPHVGGEPDDGARDDQVKQGEPRSC